MFDTIPLTRYLPGECGLVMAFTRRFSGLLFSHAHCAKPMKKRFPNALLAFAARSSLPSQPRPTKACGCSPIRRGKSKAAAFISDFRDLAVGDYVVHVEHGIARYCGLHFVDQSAEHAEETLLLEFAERTKLYVPIAKIDLVQKYVGGGKGEPALSKMGSSTWNKRKKRVAEAVVDLAQELLDIQAQRASRPGFARPARSRF